MPFASTEGSLIIQLQYQLVNVLVSEGCRIPPLEQVLGLILDEPRAKVNRIMSYSPTMAQRVRIVESSTGTLPRMPFA